MAASSAPLLGVSARRPSVACGRNGSDSGARGGSSSGAPTGVRRWQRSSTPGRLLGRHAGMLAASAALCAAALLLLAAGHLALQHGGAPVSAQQQVGAAAASNELIWPVWWFAPVWSASGYGSEAVSYITALLGGGGGLRPADLWVTHAGDAVSPAAVRGMEPATRALLERQEFASLSGVLPAADLARPAIAICHSFPDCWAAPRGAPLVGDVPMSAPGCPCPAVGEAEVVYRVGRTMYETAGLPRHLVAHCNAMDEVWVPTRFNLDTFAAAGVVRHKLRIVEEGINTTQWDPAAYSPLDPLDLGPEQMAGLPRRAAGHSSSNDTSRSSGNIGGGGDGGRNTGGDSNGLGVGGAASGGAAKAADGSERPFVFLSVFKLEARKGWDVLLDAFTREFGASEHVELHILTRPYADGSARHAVPAIMWRWLERTRGLRREADAGALPRVYVHTRHIADDMYPRLYLRADAVVLPTRGEGWGRPQMEAMAMGRPLITTNWSGPTAYISDAVAYPLAIEGLTSASADMNATDPDPAAWNTWFDGEVWARPSGAHLRALMRRVVTHRDEAAARGAAARVHVQRHFTPEVLAARVRGEVARIQAHLAARRSTPRALTAPRVRDAAGVRVAWQHVPGGTAIRTVGRGGGATAAAAGYRSASSGGGGGSAAMGANDLAALAQRARASGFSGAVQTLTLDMTTMRVGDVVAMLEAAARRGGAAARPAAGSTTTTVTRGGPGGTQGQQQGGQGGGDGARGGEPGRAAGTRAEARGGRWDAHRTGPPTPRTRSASADPALAQADEGLSSGDYADGVDDGAIVLHA